MDRRRRALRRRLLAGCALSAAVLTAPAARADLTLTNAQVSATGGQPVVNQSGSTTDITLLATRTVMNWSTYSLSSGQQVVYRFLDAGWIVLNRVTGQALIDGQIEALVGAERGQGHVWFAAPGGVVFGPNARVNVGGLLATAAQVAAAQFLDANNWAFDFTGGGAGQVLVRGGATLKANNRALVLAGGSVASEAASAVTGAGPSSVAIAAASDFTVRFGTQPGDLDLVDFVVPAGGGTASATPISLLGQTAGANVFLVAVNRAEVASAVISAPGVIAAQSATTDRGDVVLSAGVGIVNRQPGTTRLNTTTDTTATFGVVSAQRDLVGAFSAPTALTASQLSGGRDLGLSLASLSAGGLASGRQMAVDSRLSLALGGASAGTSATFRTGGALTVGSGSGALSAVGRLQVDAGSLSAGQLISGRGVAVTTSGAATLGQAQAGEDITIGAIGGLTANTLNAGRGVVVTTSGAASLGQAQSGAELSISATGGLTANTLNAGRGMAVQTSGSAALGQAQAGADLSISAAGALTVGAGSGALNAGGRLQVDAASLSAGQLNSGRGIAVASRGAVTLAQAQAGDDLSISAAGGLTANTLNAGRGMAVQTSGSAALGQAQSGADLSISAAGALTVGAGSGALSAGGRLQVDAASLSAGQLNSGRGMAVASRGAVTLAQAQAGDDFSLSTTGALTVGAGSGALGAGGRLQVDAASLSAGQLKAGRSIAVATSGTVTLGQAQAGDEISLGTTSAAASIQLGAASFIGGGVDEPPLGRNLTLSAVGAAADVTFGMAAGSPLTGATGVSVTAGRDATLNVAGLLSLTRGQAGRLLTLRAQDLDITGPTVAPDIRIESLRGAFTLGGGVGGGTASGALSAPLPGLRLTDAEFQRLQVTGQLSLYAGSPGQTERGDMQVADLSVNPARAPHLLLFAGPANDVQVTGALAPTVSGGDLVIGETPPGAAFRPGRILVSGSIGFATGSADAGYANVRAFDAVSLNAAQDVILGSQRFIVLVSAADPSLIDIGRDRPAGAAPTAAEAGHVLLTAGALDINAPIRIVQQNTGTRDRPNGLFLTNNMAAPRDTLLTVNAARVVDVFGALRDRNGNIRSGTAAGDTTRVHIDGLALGVRFNGQEVGATMANITASTALQSAQITGQADKAQEDDPAESELAAPVARPQPPLLAVAKPELAEIVTDPVTAGSGSDEIWRNKRSKPK